MPSKYFWAAVLLIAATSGGIFFACLSQRVRDVFFFLMLTLSAITEQIDVNFVSREWYRGTTCGYEISVVDVLSVSLLVSMLLFPRRGQRRWFWPASLWPMIILFLFTIVCVVVSDPKLFGYFALSKIVRGFVIFIATALYVRSERELRLFLLALAAVVFYEGLQAVEQRYRYGIQRVFGTLDAANSLSMYFCMTAPVLLAAVTSNLPRYLKILGAIGVALAFVGVILTISRAGVVTLLFTLLGTGLATISFKITLRKIGIALAVLLGVTAVLAKGWQSLSMRFEDASLKEEVQNKRKQSRLYYLRIAGAIVKENPFGIGPNNWSYWVSNKYGPRLGFQFAPYPGTDREPKHEVGEGAEVDDPQAAPAHSLGALTVGEMGYGGLVVLVFLWLRWFHMGAVFLWKRTPDPMQRLGVGCFFGTCGIFSQSLTEWVFHQTPIYFTFHIILGVLASLYFLKKHPAPVVAAEPEQPAVQRFRHREEVVW